MAQMSVSLSLGDCFVEVGRVTSFKAWVMTSDFWSSGLSIADGSALTLCVAAGCRRYKADKDYDRRF